VGAPAKVCHVCHAGYRGLYILHVASKGHQHKANPAGKPTWTKGKERGRAIGRLQRHAERETSGEGKVKVDRYRRSKPLDGREKVVRVRNYWRDRARRASAYPAYVPEHSYLQAFRR
jgi:hypothetical protein